MNLAGPGGRATRVLAALVALPALAAALVALDLARTGRARPPLAARASAVAAFEAASLGPAAAWAKEPLASADAALRAALLDWSRQESRFVARRDFRPVATALARAEALAGEAGRLGEASRAEAGRAAEETLARARTVESHALALVAVTSLPASQRARLQRARLLVREAETLMHAGDVAAARERAERSVVALREALGPALEAAERYTSEAQVATWRRWVEETRAWSRSAGQPAIVVVKEKNKLVLLVKGTPSRTYDAEIGANALGLKQRQGDHATPEGRYRIVAKKDRGRSKYHRALLLDYPNADDRRRFAQAQRRGEIPRGARIGGLIEIHGEGGRGQNWTEGCVALSNGDMDDLYGRVRVGTRVTIVGGDGRDGAFSGLLERVGEDREEGMP
jgi:lipoprotein-anchoring transpeptidase ErfK/SrfK